MLLKTPTQISAIENAQWPSIRDIYKEYETTFVVLHPFLKVKQGQNIELNKDSWPTKKQINESVESITWVEIIEDSNLKDIKELDSLLAFLHSVRPIADKAGWIKFADHLHESNITPAQIDHYPEILIDPTLHFLKELGYHTIIGFSELGKNKLTYKTQDLIDSDLTFPQEHSRIQTPDGKILISTDFDLRFSYLSSGKAIIQKIVKKLDLEGFYCEEKTKPEWSIDKQTGNTIDWNSPERKSFNF